MMKQQWCPVPECGSKVIMAQVDGEPITLNPVLQELAIQDADGNFHMVSGYPPHGDTCVDVGSRRRKRKPGGQSP